MSSLNSKQEIISSLIKYLPDLAISLSKLVNYLRELIVNTDIDPRENAIRAILSELDDTIKAIVSVTTEVEPKKQKLSEADIEIYKRYRETMRFILKGLEKMLDWVRDESKQEEDLKESIDLLFFGSQRIIELVNSLTSETTD
jgi:hypothetical protein